MSILKYTREAYTFLSLLEGIKKLKRGGNFLTPTPSWDLICKSNSFIVQAVLRLLLWPCLFFCSENHDL